MTRKSNKRFLSLILSTMLIVAMAFSMTACSDNEEVPVEDEQINTQVEVHGEGDVSSDETSDVTRLGEGETVFDFIVVDVDGNEKVYEIYTNKTVVGDALLELGLIAGDEADYGLYVKTVDGITVDYDADGRYWAFYVNGEYGMSGVDTTDIEEGATYSFKVE